ncbi:response regulator [Olivibacter sp. LS-1]|uniref:hybrid sensor histidine kinase/response regulator transcription factor n=1 Tax=Olivibacter sp. LS-1 TaxID=2592345 RepID=UPI0011EAD23B|nr:two-component regulator propeller domain-containing protein [Olivibacter sp. LS-1]QEL01248.1 response regulator [Olivibacter sp. LS-1]
MRKPTFFLIIFLFGFVLTYAQPYEFAHFDNRNGLSGNEVLSIFKDSRGFVWFGTSTGLNRFDGIAFKTFNSDVNGTNSYLYENLRKIVEDANGNLWLQGNTFLFYNWRTESFTSNIDSVLNKMGLPPYPISVQVDKDKNFYVAYFGKGIYKYDVGAKKISLFKQSPYAKDLVPSPITDMKIQDYFMWVLHRDGVLERVNTKTAAVEIRNTYIKEKLKSSIIPKNIFIDADKDIWVYPGINDKGALFFNLKQNNWTLLGVDTNPALSHSFTRCIIQDSKGMIWIGTDHGGINIYDKKRKTIRILENNVYNKYSLSQNSIISLYCDNDGIVWAGTYKNGVSYYHPSMFKFWKSPLYYLFIRNAEVFDCSSLYKDQQDNLWVGTNGKGLIKYNEQSGSMQRFRANSNDEQSISSDIITSIFEDSQRTIWIGTFLGGLNAYKNRGFKQYRFDKNNPNSLSNQSVYGIAEDHDHNLWIATLGGGINRLNPERKVFTHYNRENSPLRSDFILSTFTDASKKIYFCSDIGIYRIYKKNEIVPFFADSKLQDSVSRTPVPQLMTDSEGLIWTATKNGINIYDPKVKTFHRITTNNGLSSNDVRSLVEDGDGNIWAGTSNGLNRIYFNRKMPELKPAIISFDINDGLPSSSFNPSAVFKDKKGIIYMGTTQGYIAFNPQDIPVNNFVPTPRFTDLLIAGQVIKPHVNYNGRIIINKSIVDLDEIILKHDETNFTVQFSGLSFIHPEKNKYKYMLEGLEKQWREITNGVGVASYSNLNAGTYKLKVYAGNEDNIWSEKPIILKIIVRPPFWFSWWAWTIYVATAGLLITLFIKHKLNKQKEKFEHAQRLLEAEKLHEVDQLKLKFFTNISHEFKTPLSLIISPLEKLLTSPISPDEKSTLNMMYKNARRLLDMVNEILDFRKLDQNQLALNLSKGNIIEFAKDICASFSPLAAEKSIKLTFTTFQKDLSMQFDREKMYMIIVNLISNAFKYTREGHIDVSIFLSEKVSNKAIEKQLCFQVSDTGTGIKPEYLGKIFERFFRIESAEVHGIPGTGVGLHLVSEFVKLHDGEIYVESVVGKGSVFTVLIPMTNTTLDILKNQDVIYPGSVKNETSLDAMADLNKLPQNNGLPLLLIIDDNQDFCSFLTGLFCNDYRIVTANDGEEGYGIVLDQWPEMILCDLMMPKMDGYEFCKKIKEDMRTSHIPVILLTAKSSDENRYSGIEAGADDYISKPFNIEILKLKIVKIIEKQKLLQSRFKAKVDISPGKIEIVSMDEKFVKKAVSIAEENIGNPNFLVEDLCKEMGMSRVNFYKKIVALTDKTPSEFIRFIRLKRAADLLAKSQLYVSEISLLVGFNEAKYFRKYFKDEFGVTPNEYKKNVSKLHGD